MDTKIVGTVMLVPDLSLHTSGGRVWGSGVFSCVLMAIQMQTSTSAGGQQGGFLGALGRAVAGGTLFMTEYTAAGGPEIGRASGRVRGQIALYEVALNYIQHGLRPTVIDRRIRPCAA